LPIDVRQVRINPSSQAGGRGGGGRDDSARRSAGGGSTTGQPGDAAALRSYDVTVEMRGTVALATRPGAETAAASEPEALE
jgi:hypothetical protein